MLIGVKPQKAPNNMEDEIKYKAKHHIATGPYSFFEVDVEVPMTTIVAQARWLALQFAKEEK